MIGLDNYQDGGGFMGDQNSGQAELLKAMQAGQITGRDTTGLPLTQEPLKAESLERTLKVLESRTQDIKLFNAMPKLTAYNTVEEFLQLVSYGQQRGGFYDEGELSDVEDSSYVRRSELVKYMQVTGEVTMQAQMVRSYVDAMRKEVENKMMWIMRLANKSLTHADSDVVPQQFNSIYKQHASIGSTPDHVYANFEAYYNSGVVKDLRGESLKQTHVEEGAVKVDENYGSVNTIFAPTTVISALAQDYYKDQRIIQNAGSGYAGVIGTVPKAISTTLGDVALMSDKFMKQNVSKINTTAAESSKAPAAPTIATVALAADSLAKFAATDEGGLGNVYYAVAAVNRYGESPLAIHATAITLVAGSSVDFTFTAGAGSFAATGYVIYRSKVTTAVSTVGLEFFPIFKVSETDRTNGYNGGAAGKIRDRGYFLPDTEQCFITEMSDDVLSFKQLAPISKLDLAVLSMSRRFICFLFGTPQLYAGKKIVRYINVGKRLTT